MTVTPCWIAPLVFSIVPLIVPNDAEALIRAYIVVKPTVLALCGRSRDGLQFTSSVDTSTPAGAVTMMSDGRSAPLTT